MTQIAFLGLGAIGAPMARQLARPPFELTVWNRTRARADAFARQSKARVAATPADAARGAAFVVTCLPTSREVESLLDGADGLLAGMERGAIAHRLHVGRSRHLAPHRRPARANAASAFIDAPVSGGTIGAEQRHADGDVRRRCRGVRRERPVLDAFGEKIVHCGPVGAGHALKAVNNALLAVHIWATGEDSPRSPKRACRPRSRST